MNAREIITMAEAAGVVLSVQAGKLRYVGEAQAVESILPALRDHKAEVIRELTGFIDPVEVGYMPSFKAMASRSECRGYPTACPRCRLLMADLKTCLLGPEAEHAATPPQKPTGATQAQGRGFGRISQKNAARGILARNTQHGGNRYGLH